jgi:hypothetical protein
LLRLLDATKIIAKKNRLTPIIQEVGEITHILGTIIVKAKVKSEKEKTD